MRGCEEEASSSEIFERRTGNKSSTNKDESTSERTIEESSLNEEDEVYLKTSHEENDYEVTKSSYKQLFKTSAKLIEENDKVKKA